MSFTWFVGARYLRARQKQAFISLITFLATAGIAVGVMALIVVIAVMTGFEAELQNRILGIESHVLVMRYGETVSDIDATVAAIESIDGVRSASPFVYTQVMLRSPHGVTGAVLKALDPSRPGPPIVVRHNRPLARVLNDAAPDESAGKAPGLIVGGVTAEKLQVAVGDPIFLISPLGKGAGASQMPTVMRFSVAGIFETGMNEYDGAMSFVRLDVAQRLLQMPGQATGLEVRVDDIYQARTLADDIVASIGFPFWARDWMQMNRNLFSMLRLQKTVMFIILTLIVLVAAFNIASALIMMVMEKTRDIAILKTLGATNRHIRRIFVFKGLVIGCLGTVVGGLMGFVVCSILKRYPFIKLPGDVYFLTTLPVSLQPLDVIIIGLSTVVICFLATLYPATSASALDPVDGIRYG
ncbi:ABC transporter permease [Desulfosarcina alkanivorans]|uniref:ABC transporter permease n=1 Tax=Desulfosarcina alkanivorans TaxID=571177 RepID=A0A5K7YCT4_9BACT|nr:lipoprotein-releasing ABC transporter permease subunit [Desulfosarcina alkanivorans]BBO66225.1 ABC transporter permease [Desulfosarcina alkanivorans]